MHKKLEILNLFEEDILFMYILLNNIGVSIFLDIISENGSTSKFGSFMRSFLSLFNLKGQKLFFMGGKIGIFQRYLQWK